jgi:PAS domain S-box-containing protein
MRSGLGRRFSLTLTTVALINLVVVAVCFFVYTSVRIEEDLQDQLEQTVNFARISLPTAIWQLNYRAMDNVLKAIMINNAVVAVRILAEGEVVASKTAAAYGNTPFDTFAKSKGYLVRAVEVYSEGEKAGEFQIAVSRQAIRKELVSPLIAFAVLAVFLLAAILVTSLFITRKHVFMPLARLEQSARRIAEGDLETGIDIGGRDEIARLAGAFNTMAQRLKISFDTLEQKVNERTADLIDAKIETERINQEIREAGARLQALLDNYPVGILFVDHNRRIMQVNAEMSRISGYSQEELIGGTTRKFYATDEDYLDNGRRNYPALYQTGSLEIRNNLLRKDGVSILCSWRARVIESSGGMEGVVWSVEDISHRIQMEEELLKIKKLESVAVLAGGIAHDFNNILVAVIGNISLAERLSEAQPQVRELLQRAGKASLRARELVVKLLTFAGGGEPARGGATSLGDLLRETVPFILSGSNVKYRLDIPEDIWLVRMERGQVDQVFQNLVLNADQSMPEGGVVTVSCSNVETGISDIPGLQQGRYVRVLVTDTGQGIGDGHIDRIFDPYFSTKQKDSQKGSGLGLSIVHSIVTRHNGRIDVDSRPGEGTTFTLHLPAADGMVDDQKHGEEIIVRGKGRIMIMDDEEIVRRVVCDMLSYLGYEGVEAIDGQEAIDLYRDSLQSGRKIDAVIMDLTIPGGMGGKEAVRRLQELDPGVRAIVSSGYSDDPVIHDYGSAGFCDIVAKPYQLIELSRTLTRVLTGEPC